MEELKSVTLQLNEEMVEGIFKTAVSEIEVMFDSYFTVDLVHGLVGDVFRQKNELVDQLEQDAQEWIDKVYVSNTYKEARIFWNSTEGRNV